jgi:hypothetical protein
VSQSFLAAASQRFSEVSMLPSPQELALLDLVIQRSVVDAQFRLELLNAPQDTLREAGIQTDGIGVDVREIDENKLVLVLPPVLEFSEPTESRNPYTDQPSSPPIIGLATTAVANPLDGRVTLNGPNGTGSE